MMSVKFTQVLDDEWIRPTTNPHPVRCCDCGLTHEIEFRVAADGAVEFRAVRNERATGQRRRHMKKKGYGVFDGKVRK